ncbi:Endoglucanase [Labilithrix luteola]|uniref:Endoglucanase n=1 Tax=Labilithrix luteola TaxID=1391654 RepID=A0A0K1PXS5_9BACT|nr:glycoside hydrolase family 5 protein [Labilithrix luteola]AKU98191.1 Endoglucanase [Labilithrix luteola]
MKFLTHRRIRNVKRTCLALSAMTLLACGAGAGDSQASEAVPTAGANGNTGTPGATKVAETLDPTAQGPDIPAGPMPFRGVNLAGAEFGDPVPGVEGQDYHFTTNEEVDYFMSKGMNTFRFGFKWERLQPQANGEFDATYANKLDAVVNYAASKGAHVILNPHNFARYYGKTVGSASMPSSVFADLWKRLATKYAGNPNIMFNLVNEPHDIPMNEWVDAANAAIQAIRGAGAANTIIVPGNNWTGAHSWNDGGDQSNATAMLQINDPLDNSLFEVHQYLDANSGGGSGACVSPTIGSERLKGWVDWLRTNHKKGFVGEFAGRNDATCNAAVTDMLNYMNANSDVISGWLWWAAGPNWGNYVFSLEPQNNQDRPQMSVIKPYLFAQQQ